MLSRKIEVIGALVIWFFVLWLLQFCVLKTSTPSPLETYCSVASSVFILAVVLSMYRTIRNRCFANKLYSYIYRNDMQNAQAFVDKALIRQPKTKWLQVEQCVLFGMTGDLAKFYSAYTVLSNMKKIAKKLYPIADYK